MLNRIAFRFQQLWNKFPNKAYRDAFVSSHLRTNVAAQITTIREDRGWTQKHLAEAAGMAQPRISVLEDPNYDKMTLSTLRRVASAFDVALDVRFVAFSALLRSANSASPDDLSVPSFADDHPPEAESDGQPKAFPSPTSPFIIDGDRARGFDVAPLPPSLFVIGSSPPSNMAI